MSEKHISARVSPFGLHVGSNLHCFCRPCQRLRRLSWVLEKYHPHHNDNDFNVYI